MTTHKSMRNLTTLIKRLEAATSCLEDIATSTEPPQAVPTLSQLTSPVSNHQASPPTPSSSKQPPAEPLPELIENFDLLLASSLDRYVNLSNELEGPVAQQAAEVLHGFQQQRRLLFITLRAAKPDLPTFQKLVQPINDALLAATKIKESHRSDAKYTHLSAVADGIMMLAWVTVDNRPHKHVDDCLSSAQFFGNRVLKEQKDKDPRQIEWIQGFYQIFGDLSGYIKQHFPSGLSWNAQGESALEVANSHFDRSQAPASLSSNAGSLAPPPPPPPPGPPPVLDIQPRPPAAAAAPGGFDAVFSELNKGATVTQGLRKVDKSGQAGQKSSLRAASGAGTAAEGSARAKSPAPGKKPKPESMRSKRPPRKELEGMKWAIENFDKEPQPIELDVSLAQSVLISRCSNTTVIIRGKANQVTVENSSRLSLVVDTLVSTVDVVKAQNFALQVLGTVPTVMLDQVDSAQVYLSKESTDTKLYTSKSDGVNLNVLHGSEDDYKEVPLPAQIRSYFDKQRGTLVNEIVAHAD